MDIQYFHSNPDKLVIDISDSIVMSGVKGYTCALEVPNKANLEAAYATFVSGKASVFSLNLGLAYLGNKEGPYSKKVGRTLSLGRIQPTDFELSKLVCEGTETFFVFESLVNKVTFRTVPNSERVWFIRCQLR